MTPDLVLPMTHTRRLLASAVDRGEVWWYPFRKPIAVWKRDRGLHQVEVTGRFKELCRASFAIPLDPRDASSPWPTGLTDSGRAWLAGNGGTP